VPLVLHMKMGRAVVCVVHANVNAEKEGDDGRCALRRSASSYTSYTSGDSFSTLSRSRGER
jgi:hypothetical protein